MEKKSTEKENISVQSLAARLMGQVKSDAKTEAARKNWLKALPAIKRKRELKRGEKLEAMKANNH